MKSIVVLAGSSGIPRLLRSRRCPAAALLRPLSRAAGRPASRACAASGSNVRSDSAELLLRVLTRRAAPARPELLHLPLRGAALEGEEDDAEQDVAEHGVGETYVDIDGCQRRRVRRQPRATRWRLTTSPRLRTWCAPARARSRTWTRCSSAWTPLSRSSKAARVPSARSFIVRRCLRQLNATVMEFKGLLDEVQSGKGSLGPLVTSDEAYKKGIAAIDKINALVDGLQQGKGTAGSFFTVDSVATWYATIQKPSFNPPDWVFGPVWTVLYILMGLSAYLVWMKGWGRKEVRNALAVFGFQLVLNALWSIIFFGAKELFYSFVEILFLWLSIALTMALFYRISKNAALLLVPYLLWVSFAAFLNYSVWQMNLV